MTGNTPSATVTLDFRCSVTQWTGENWDNVSLALTTGDQVSQLIQVPEPKRIDVSLGPTYIPPGFNAQPTLFGSPARQSMPPRGTGYSNDSDEPLQRRPAFGAGLMPVQAQTMLMENNAPPAITPQAQMMSSAVSEEIRHDYVRPSPQPAPPPLMSYPTSVVANLFGGQTPEVDTPSKTVSQLVSHVCFVRHFIVSEASLTPWGTRVARIRSRMSLMDLYLFLLTALHTMFSLLLSLCRQSSCESQCPVSTPGSITQCAAFSFSLSPFLNPKYPV